MTTDNPSDHILATTLYLTAGEAYPALEALFLEARSEISAGFRIFDPQTRLRSPAGRAIGETWGDLVAHVLAKGVRIRLVLADFDPYVWAHMHRLTWQAVFGLRAAAERSGRPDLLDLQPSLHPARIGLLTRIALLPKIRKTMAAEAKRLNGLPPDVAAEQWHSVPGLHAYFHGNPPDLRLKWNILPALAPASHHQKLAVFDREKLFIGGLDLNERRYDTLDHARPSDETWHDTQILVTGPVAEQAHHHLEEFLSVTQGDTLPAPLGGLVRTLSRRKSNPLITLSPAPVLQQIESMHLDQIAKAKRFIYLESQYFRSKKLARALQKAAVDCPTLTVLMVLPAAPDVVAFDNSRSSDARYGEYLQAYCVETVSRAFGERCFVMAPAQPKRAGNDEPATHGDAPLVYLHAKVSVFDDHAAIVSSANLNGRSLRWDTETGVTLRTPKDVTNLRHRSLDHWLGGDTAEANIPPEQIVARWRAIAQENAALDPEKRRGFLLPYPVTRAKRFGRNLPGIPEEMV